ncbi:diguanylate cyclase [Oxalicibacterium flavum]|uniref:Diguanylate cyclase n=1 Tax=Oxalicibacterium flavum TaxID=179467 RepID=A0A8J2UQ61_9BURK|nr:EAL domain-containing protein [Oxalicibacterium flavum]GGC04667.1 diguanylate cyclase [Oxalicibacterium flavum]
MRHSHSLNPRESVLPPAGPSPFTAGKPVWQVMIVGKDAGFHTAVSFALARLDMREQPLDFLHVRSFAQAQAMWADVPKLAMLVLDDCSLPRQESMQLLHALRNAAHLQDTRIVVRSEHDKHAPAYRTFGAFDISACLPGEEIDRQACMHAFSDALRAYGQLDAIRAGNRGLDKILHANRELTALTTIEEFAPEVLRQLTDLLQLPEDGLICIRETLHDRRTESFVVAATGNYKALINHPVSTLDTGVQAIIEQAMEARHRVQAHGLAALYFAGEGARCLVVLIRVERALDDVETRLLDVFASIVSIGLTNILLVTRLHNSAYYDSLTKLPNRVRLKDILDDTLEETASAPATLALIDIDHFAETNDALGHRFGDYLLLAIATRLQSHLGHHLVVARIGGDTFGVLGDEQQVTPEAILAQFERPFAIDSHQVQISATVGLLRLAEHAGSGAEALKNAHIALKRAKSRQRAGHLYFSRSMDVDIRERVNMMHALRRTFEENRLFVVYQPQIDMVTREPVGAEALLRWRGDDGAMISPERFIPIAEYSGLIVELGEWVLRQACLQTVRLREHGFADFMIAVNVSQVQLRHPQFLAMLKRTLAESQAVAHCIELEITESMAMDDPEALTHLLDQITATGVSIAIDDFGTGFSSLSHLQKLNVDRLKIDRAFVAEITESARGSSIAEAIIQLGRNLDLDVIAEGVENERQAMVLSELGCSCAQGYLFAQPLTSEKLEEWLRLNSRKEGGRPLS